MYLYNLLNKISALANQEETLVTFTYFSTAITLAAIVVSVVLFFVQNRDTAEYGLSLEDLGIIGKIHFKQILLIILLVLMLILSSIEAFCHNDIPKHIKHPINILSFLFLIGVCIITAQLINILNKLSADNMKKNIAEKILNEAKQWNRVNVYEEVKNNRILNKIMLNTYLHPSEVRETLLILYKTLISEIVDKNHKTKNRISNENLFFLAYEVSLVFCDMKGLKRIQKKKTMESLEIILYKIKNDWKKSESVEFLLIGILTGFLGVNERKKYILDFLYNCFDYNTYTYDENNEFFSMIIGYFIFLAEFHVNMEKKNATLFYYLETYSAKWNRDSITTYMDESFFREDSISKSVFYFWGIIYKNMGCMSDTFEQLKEEINEGNSSVYLMAQIKEK